MSREPSITPRPQSLLTETTRVQVGCGEMYIILSRDPECFECEIHLGKAGNCASAYLMVIANLITLSRRHLNPIPRALIIKALAGIKCSSDSGFVPSCPEAIAKVLREKWGL